MMTLGRALDTLDEIEPGQGVTCGCGGLLSTDLCNAQLSMFGVAADNSVVAWDIIECGSNAAAAEHAIGLLERHKDAAAVEVWDVAEMLFQISTDGATRRYQTKLTHAWVVR